jgi:hypothetical protein
MRSRGAASTPVAGLETVSTLARSASPRRTLVTIAPKRSVRPSPDPLTDRLGCRHGHPAGVELRRSAAAPPRRAPSSVTARSAQPGPTATTRSSGRNTVRALAPRPRHRDTRAARRSMMLRMSWRRRPTTSGDVTRGELTGSSSVADAGARGLRRDAGAPDRDHHAEHRTGKRPSASTGSSAPGSSSSLLLMLQNRGQRRGVRGRPVNPRRRSAGVSSPPVPRPARWRRVRDDRVVGRVVARQRSPAAAPTVWANRIVQLITNSGKVIRAERPEAGPRTGPPGRPAEPPIRTRPAVAGQHEEEKDGRVLDGSRPSRSDDARPSLAGGRLEWSGP